MSKSKRKYPVKYAGFACSTKDRNAANKKERLAVKRVLKSNIDELEEFPMPCEQELRNNRSPLNMVYDNLGRGWGQRTNPQNLQKIN